MTGLVHEAGGMDAAAKRRLTTLLNLAVTIGQREGLLRSAVDGRKKEPRHLPDDESEDTHIVKEER
jgi:hypothetical protein